jgi:hypothetical protein
MTMGHFSGSFDRNVVAVAYELGSMFLPINPVNSSIE